ncbi:MAG: DNA alkylation repair protein [Clostridiales bacterium]|nr:DNA alkylation repair protein [Clostridiales bacterium]
MIVEVRRELMDAVDLEYKKFHQGLVPGLDCMLGVRMPKVREIARRASKMADWKKEWGMLDTGCYEELMIKGILIGVGKLTREERVEMLREFVPLIDNWAVCDCCCSSLKFMQKESEFWGAFLEPYFVSEREFEVRFAVVSVLDHFIREDYLEKIFEIFDGIRQDGYYVKMAVAWAVSVCFVKFPTETFEYLKKDRLDDFTHNKAIQKVRESYRVSKEGKERLLVLKRKEK